MKLLLPLLIFCYSVLPAANYEKKLQIGKDYIITERDLIPEGLAYDAVAQNIYVSSTHKCKIIRIDKNGKITDFISEGQNDIKSIIGMEVDIKRRCLWAVSSEAADVLPLKNMDKRQWWSSVYQFDLDNGTLVKKYALNRDSVFLNDLTVAADGTVYVTESLNNKVYKITPGKDSLQLFAELQPYTFINGICFTDKLETLFVSSIEGIISIDLIKNNYSLLPVGANNKALAIDGLAFAGDYFIGHQSKMICRFYLSAGRDKIISVDTLDAGKEFDGSTTGEESNGYYYYIVNSQIRSGIDYARKAIRPVDSLNNIIIRKRKL